MAADKIVKKPGADWDVYYMDLDGHYERMFVFGSATPEEALAEARYSLNAAADTEEEKDQFEILAVIRHGANIDTLLER